MKAKDDDMLTIGGDIIAAHLENTGYLNMAAFVRHLDGAVARANLRADDAGRYADELARRLEQYEQPTAKEKRHDPRPPAEASD